MLFELLVPSSITSDATSPCLRTPVHAMQPRMLVPQTVAFVHGHRQASWHSEDTGLALEQLRWEDVEYISLNRMASKYWECAPPSQLAPCTAVHIVHIVQHKIERSRVVRRSEHHTLSNQRVCYMRLLYEGQNASHM